MSSVTRRDVLRAGVALSASGLVPASVRHVEALLTAYPDVPSAEASSAVAPRERLLLDFNWMFFQGNAADPRHDLGFGTGQGDFAKSGEFEFATAKFDDSKWRSLNLPHDWAVELPFVRDEEQQDHGYKPLGRRYPETSIGWYRRTFDLGKDDAGRRISVEFDGAFRSALVFLNGYFIGRNDNGYAPFCFDLTDFANFSGRNFLVVRMDASFGDGWFYEGAGIYRHVWLTKTDPLHLGRWETYVRPAAKGNSAAVALGTVVQNQGASAESCRVRWQILDHSGKVVGTADSAAQAVPPDSSVTFTASASISNPALWSPETPNLYSAVATIEAAGKTRDAERVNFGVRTIAWDPDKGFFLNGKRTEIKGTCNHQDHAGVGAALPDRLQWYRLAVLKDMGGNAVRTSHNMPTPEWVEACDRMGMMMMCETRQMSSNPEGMAQLETMIKRYRNSPSIILWSMGNEENTLME
ncbi:MAG: glycoside hydrolase family 2 TIM barrel-domain containing protein, partial [Acidobacteriota bacterium]